MSSDESSVLTIHYTSIRKYRGIGGIVDALLIIILQEAESCIVCVFVCEKRMAQHRADQQHSNGFQFNQKMKDPVQSYQSRGCST